jgi:hypothetical protein
MGPVSHCEVSTTSATIWSPLIVFESSFYQRRSNHLLFIRTLTPSPPILGFEITFRRTCVKINKSHCADIKTNN